MDSDEEERLQRWKEHLASQANNDDDDGLMPPPEEGSEDEREDDADASVNSGRGGGGSSSRGKAQAGWEGGGAGSPSAQGGAVPSSVRFDDGGGSATGGGQGASQEIDWATALMPQLRETQMENAMLQKRLQQADREINALRSLPSVGAGSPGGFEQARPDSSYRDAKDAKIVELAKKNRALTVALEKERAKSGRMAAEVTRMNGQLQEASKGRDMSGMDARSLPKGAAGGREPAGATRRGGKKGEEDEEDKPSPEAQIKTLQGKLSNMNAALNAQRVANDTLKQENGKLLSVLKRELGDVPVERALEEGGGWTGRAQQVSLLQSKITSLRRELQAAREGGAGGGAAGGGLGVPGSPQQDGAMREEEKRRKEIDKIEREKRREQDVGAEELERVRKERDENKRMYGAAQSRVKNLEKDCKDLRDKISVLLTKTDNDDSLIAALQQEMQNMARQNKENKRKEREQQGSISELQELRGQISERESQIERQHKIIVSLRAEAQASSMRREGEHREAVANGVDAVRATQAEQKARMAEVQVSKAGELGEMLKRRLEEAEVRLQEANSNLRREKQRAVELERRAEGNSRQPHGGGSSAGGRRANSAPGGYPPEKVEMLVDRLNGMTEEMEALQESFKRTLEVKEGELGHLRECLRQLEQHVEAGQEQVERQLAKISARM